MMDETKQLTEKIPAKRQQLLADYADAAGCLYGVLSINEFVEVFNNYENEKTDYQETYTALIEYENTHEDTVEYSIYEDFITGPTIHPNDFEDEVEYLNYIRLQQRDKPRYLPVRKEFLKYRKAFHREPEKPYTELKKYLLENNFNDDNEYTGVDNDLWNIHEMIQDGAKHTELLDYFTDNGLDFDNLEDVNSFLQVLMDVNNNTRIFENNGYTPNELMEILKSKRPKNQEPVIMSPKKVGRNEPCPCGSGKKYKKCCYLIEIGEMAHLTYNECVLFYETWYKLLDYVNHQKNVIEHEFSLKYGDLHDEVKLHKIRDKLWQEPKLISKFIEDSIYLIDEEIKLLVSWEKYHIKGQFTLVKYTPRHAILMRAEENQDSKLYAVMGMTSSIAEIMLRKLPVMLNTVLLPFGNKIIYDGYMGALPLVFGDGAISMYEKAYSESIEKYGITYSLSNNLFKPGDKQIWRGINNIPQ